MIRFLFTGLLRDKSRSRIPVLVVAIGVMLSVFLHAYVTGFIGDSIELNARFSTGHVKIMTKAYADNIKQMPNDLALLDVGEMMNNLEKEYSTMQWVARIQFGGLVDVPDENGETRSQGPAAGFALDMLSGDNSELLRMNIPESMVRGKLPSKAGEVLLSDEFSKKLKVDPGDVVTLISSSMNGAMVIYNFVVSGTVRFGSSVLDRGTIIADIEDVRLALDMQDAAGELLGYFNSGFYDDGKAQKMLKSYNDKNFDESDEFSPYMVSLRDQNSMALYVDMTNQMTTMLTMIFMLAMAIVLWNAGLLGTLRRYGEMGIRLAMGEEKSHIYKTLIAESIMIGIAGSILGTVLGLFFSWLIQTYGIDIGSMMQGSSIMMPSVIRARITPVDFYIGFYPGVLSTVIGTMLAGIGIYKRQTARLFKELEA